jgi:hypothetical protein
MLGSLDGTGSRAYSELLVDVLDVCLDRRAADAKLLANASERPIGGEKRQDAALGRR